MLGHVKRDARLLQRRVDRRPVGDALAYVGPAVLVQRLAFGRDVLDVGAGDLAAVAFDELQRVGARAVHPADVELQLRVRTFLRDQIERGSLDLSALVGVVLDEADEMLDMGFRDDLEEILDAAPEQRRTLLFSATMPQGIVRLAER